VLLLGKFDDNVLYEIMVDNTGDAVEDITFQFRFNSQILNPNTFLYNTGPISSIDDPNLNVRQYYHAAAIEHALGNDRDARRLLSRALDGNPRFDLLAAPAAQALSRELGGGA